MRVFQDTTDELAKHYEIQEETIAQLKEVSDLKDDFISVASHELRTPITSLMGYINIVNDPRLEEKRKVEVEAGMERQVRRLHDLVEDLLAVGLIDSDRSAAVGEPSDIKVFVEELVLDLQKDNNDRKVDLVFDESISKVKNISFDKNFLRRILNNLIQNAFNYSDAKTKVSLNISKENDRIYFEIKDSGFGIAASELDKIFEKFHRANANRNISGTGLGLYIVKGLVESMGGEITVESKVGTGTSMKFYITI